MNMARVSYGCMLDTAKLKACREKLGLSMADAARIARIGTAQAWNKIENGDGLSLTLKTLNKMATGLKIPAKDLLK